MADLWMMPPSTDWHINDETIDYITLSTQRIKLVFTFIT